MKIRFVDLFAGIGGIRLGLEQALNEHGLESECVFSSEINETARQTYKLNFGETPDGDIHLVKALPEHDVLLAGFPCQAFSYAGSRKGFADTRGTLFFEIERLLKSAIKKPRILLLENVRGFMTHDGGRTFETVRKSLEQLGYGVQAILKNSTFFGVPQNRVRVYIVCVLGSTPNLPFVSDAGYADSHKFKQSNQQYAINFFEQDKLKTVADILETDVDKKYHCSEKFLKQLRSALKGKHFDTLHGVRLIDSRGGNSLHSWDLGLKGPCSKNERQLMDAIIKNRRKKTFGTHQDGKRLSMQQISTFWSGKNLDELLNRLVEKGYLSIKDGTYNPVAGNMSFEVFKFLDPDSISITVVSTDAHRLGVVQNAQPRRITPRECARLQGFPDEFVLHPSDKWAYHQLGNTVTVPAIAKIAKSVFEQHVRYRTANHSHSFAS